MASLEAACAERSRRLLVGPWLGRMSAAGRVGMGWGAVETTGANYERYPGAALRALPAALRLRSGQEYARREPEKTVLHQVVRQHWGAFLERMAEEERGIPGFAKAEVERYLGCGRLSEGFVRVLCRACGFDRLVAFSCKGRGLCPACGSRRMAETAALLVDELLPKAPYRQWVLTVPFRVRYLLARKPELVTVVLACFLRAVAAHLRRSAKRLGLPAGQVGSVSWIQRFGSSINVHVHVHAVVADGVFVEEDDGEVSFHAVPAPTDAEVEELCAKVAVRVTRLLRKRGFLDGEREEEAGDMLSRLQAASVQAGRTRSAGEPPRRRRCAAVEGYSVHADTHLHAHDRQGLEHLCRYAARNSIALSRLERDESGKVVYRFKKPRADGSTCMVLEPLDFIGRL